MPIATSENDIKERLSIAYVTAVAAGAGCQVAKMDIDKESVDAIVRPVSGLKAQVNLQIKATSQDIFDGQDAKFSLSVKKIRLRSDGLGSRQPGPRRRRRLKIASNGQVDRLNPQAGRNETHPIKDVKYHTTTVSCDLLG